MTLRPNDLISLDTNVLVHWIRQNDTGVHLRESYKLHERMDRPIYSTIVEGELRALAGFLRWEPEKLKRLEEILSELVRVDAGLPDVVKAYAEIYIADRTGGHNTGQNDMWIAATTKAAGAVLLTCDDDCLWMNSNIVAVEYVRTEKGGRKSP